MSSTTENLARLGEALAAIASSIQETNAQTDAAAGMEQAENTLAALADLDSLRIQAQVEAVYAARYEAGMEPDDIAGALREDELRVRGMIFTYASAAMVEAERQAAEVERAKYGRWKPRRT